MNLTYIQTILLTGACSFLQDRRVCIPIAGGIPKMMTQDEFRAALLTMGVRL
jgi:hypothetical protein